MANHALVEKVKREVIKYHYEGIVFTSTEQIKKKLQAETEMELKTPQLLKILHEELGARYKKIKQISWQGNSVKNILLRQ